MLRGFLILVLFSLLGEALRLVFVLLIMPGVVGAFFTVSQFQGQWLAVVVALLLGAFASLGMGLTGVFTALILPLVFQL